MRRLDADGRLGRGSGPAAGRGWPAPTPCVRRWSRNGRGAAGLSCGRCSQSGAQAASCAAVTSWSVPNRPRIGRGQASARSAHASRARAPAPGRRCRSTGSGLASAGRTAATAAQIVVRLGVEHGDPRRQRRSPGSPCCAGTPSARSAATRSAPTGVQRSAGVARILPSAAGDPALIREGRRQHRPVPRPGPQARGELRQRRAAQQAVDLLVGDRRPRPGAGVKRRQRRRVAGAAASSRVPLSSAALAAGRAGSAPCQRRAPGRSSPTNSAAVSSAPVRSSARRRSAGHAAGRRSRRAALVRARAVCSRGGSGRFDERVQLHALAAHREADAGDRPPVRAEHRGGDGAQPVRVLAVGDGVAARAHRGQPVRQARRGRSACARIAARARRRPAPPVPAPADARRGWHGPAPRHRRRSGCRRGGPGRGRPISACTRST